MNFPHYFKEYKKQIDTYLDQVLVSTDPDIKNLIDAARYSSLNGGKRIRGVIALTMGSLLSSKLDFMPLAAGIELIHTYSLIHDDLPAMDNDDYRRGKLSCHKVYGEDIAILAGDFLLTFAYLQFSEALSKHGFESDNIVKTISYLSKQIGLNGMVGGQIIDIESTNKKIDLTLLKKMHALKTGAFIEASFISPLILLNGKPDLIPGFDLSKYSKNIGLLFQLIDDILDEIGDSEKMGKKQGSDKKLNKATYTSMLGLKNAQTLAADLYTETKNELENLSDKKIKKALTDFVDIIYKREF
ncbi:MAG: hypothetical protein A2Y40_04595 [Candidatus Margulisbacteria bacterium GWF2_35_9]|nr:MAG: hypothetical protein A2Y40_04595 [Candidatus Margulisbacteria bacterium GWF2_35_9]